MPSRVTIANSSRVLTMRISPPVIPRFSLCQQISRRSQSRAENSKDAKSSTVIISNALFHERGEYLVSARFSRAGLDAHAPSRSGRSHAAIAPVGAQSDLPYDFTLRTKNERLSLASADIDSTSSTSFSVFSPETAVIMSFDFFASANSSGSLSV